VGGGIKKSLKKICLDEKLYIYLVQRLRERGERKIFEKKFQKD
jgi:hypothetical protein